LFGDCLIDDGKLTAAWETLSSDKVVRLCCVSDMGLSPDNWLIAICLCCRTWCLLSW